MIWTQYVNIEYEESELSVYVHISVLNLREGATYEEVGNYRRAFQSSGVARVAAR